MRIRPLRTADDYLAAEKLQKDVWGFPDREIIPLNELVVAQRNGGYAFAAFEDATMAAFCFGVIGWKGGRPYHYSRMLGVRPKWQNSGLGFRMKLRQREFVLRQRLDLVRWTFDPLQSRNAKFNVAKLGVTIREYAANLYGFSQSRFNAGVGSDRFVVDWRIRSPRVLSRVGGAEPMSPDRALALPPVLEARRGAPGPVRFPKADRVRVEIPADIDTVKRRDMGLAIRWRRATRRAFTTLFARGYAVTDFVHDAGRSFYVVTP